MERIKRLEQAAIRQRDEAKRSSFELFAMYFLSTGSVLIQIWIVIIILRQAAWQTVWQLPGALFISAILLMVSAYLLYALHKRRARQLDRQDMRLSQPDRYRVELQNRFGYGMVERLIAQRLPLDLVYDNTEPLWRMLSGMPKPRGEYNELLMYAHLSTNLHRVDSLMAMPPLMRRIYLIGRPPTLLMFIWYFSYSNFPDIIAGALLVGMLAGACSYWGQICNSWRFDAPFFSEYLLSGLELYRGHGTLQLDPEFLQEYRRQFYADNYQDEYDDYWEEDDYEDEHDDQDLDRQQGPR